MSERNQNLRMLKVQRSETHKVKAPAGMVAEDWGRFIELPYFVNKWQHLGLDDEDLRALQVLLTVQPRLGAVMEGTGGLRKLRFARSAGGQGKSGSFRIGYVYFEDFHVIGLLAVYAKKDQGNLSQAEKNTIRKLIERLRELLEK